MKKAIGWFLLGLPLILIILISMILFGWIPAMVIFGGIPALFGMIFLGFHLIKD